MQRIFHLPFLFDLVLCMVWVIPRASSFAWTLLFQPARLRATSHRHFVNHRN